VKRLKPKVFDGQKGRLFKKEGVKKIGLALLRFSEVLRNLPLEKYEEHLLIKTKHEFI
jgi:hypothetical protein